MLLTCSCGATNRIPSLPKARVRCGKCQYEFKPADLMKARPEPAPDGFALSGEPDEEDTIKCKCGWEGTEDDLEVDDNDRLRCPDCDKRIRLGDDD